ncbi:MAG TPA: NAD(P)H-binding protein [Woeseiaceae bacterium]|nr:NAD(P)H-binding protein [Woeseiaceae bacterium]
MRRETALRVAVFGGTGFVGGYVVDALLDAGHEPSLLVRAGSEHKVRQPERCRMIPGDLQDRDAIAAVLDGAHAAIYLVGILRERRSAGITFDALQYDGVRRCVDLAVAEGVRRFLLMSANGVRDDGTPYERSKLRAELYLKDSALAWTIMRPSIIFGDPRGAMEFCTQLRDEMVSPPLPAVSFFSGWRPSRGAAVMSPVHVEDVAAAFVAALKGSEMLDRSFALGGPEILSWSAILRRVAAACGRRKWIVPVPAGLVHAAAAVFDRFAWFPVTRDQLTMLMRGNVVTDRAAFDLLGIEPRRMTMATLTYLGRR